MDEEKKTHSITQEMSGRTMQDAHAGKVEIREEDLVCVTGGIYEHSFQQQAFLFFFF